MDKKKKIVRKKPVKKLVKNTKKINKSSIKSTKDKSVKVNVNVNSSGGTGSGGTSIPQPIPQMVYQSQRDKGEDDIINKFNNLLNKVGSKPPEKMVFDMQTQFNPMTNEMGAQIDNPIFSDSSSNIEIVRKPDLSNQILLENINTPQIDDMALKVNEYTDIVLLE